MQLKAVSGPFPVHLLACSLSLITITFTCLSDECLVVVDAQLLKEGLSDLIDVAHNHRGEEDFGQGHRHGVYSGHDLHENNKKQ